MSRKVKANLGIRGGESREVELEVPDAKPSPWDLDSKLHSVGSELRRLDGPLKSTGRARYTFDVQLPGMLFGKTLRSPHACAEVRSVELEAATEVPGVVAVKSVAPRRVRYAGEEIAVVAAETEAAAEEALRRIVVDYAVEPFVLEAADAREEGAPSVFGERRENVRPDRDVELGDVDEAFARAASVVQSTYTTQSQLHTSFESHGSVVRWEEDGSLTCWTSTQATFGVRQNLARSLKLKLSQVRVICEYMGGGFGSKFGPGPFTLHAAEHARETGRPVKMMLDRREEHLVGGSRPDSTQKVAVAADAKGKFLGAWVTSFGTGGIAGGAGVQNPKIYDFSDNVRKRHENVFTNRAPSCAFRAPGHPQGIFALESAIDELADKLRMDPLELRRANDRDPIRLHEYELGAKAIGWANRVPFEALDPDGPAVVRGYGMASSLWYNAGREGFKVAVEVFPDGTVVVRNGAQDIGTGTRTVLAICVGEELGIDPAGIDVRMGDTRDPPGPASGGSATAPCLAPAARDAGWLMARELFQLAAPALGVQPGDLEAVAGRVQVRAEPARGMTFVEAASLIREESLQVTADRDPNYGGYQRNCAGVQFVEVEVDTETGVVAVKRVVAVQDAGIVIDRLTFESQVIGGVIQGLSFALFEDRILDPTTGNLVNPDLLHYKIAGAMDMPEIQVLSVDVANGMNSTSTMGVGEPPIIPTPGAIANAIANACGARVRSLPITPWAVLEALGKV